MAIVILILTAGAWISAGAAGEVPPDPVEILREAAAAAKDVHSVRYTARSTPTGAVKRYAVAAEGEAAMVGWSEWDMPQKFYVHLKLQDLTSGETVELSGGGNGDSYFLVDHQSRKAYEDMDPAVMGTIGKPIPSFGMPQFVQPTPFAEDLAAEKIELQGVETVNGEECYRVHVAYGRNGRTSTWFFAKQDHLPRRRLQQLAPQLGEGSLTIDIMELEVNLDLEPSIFKLQLPAGYEQVDDFAP
jgi:hypothetical protein